MSLSDRRESDEVTKQRSLVPGRSTRVPFGEGVADQSAQVLPVCVGMLLDERPERIVTLFKQTRAPMFRTVQ